LLLLAIPVVVIIFAMVFGYFLPSWNRRRRRSGPLALALSGRDGKVVVPPRPVREEATAPVRQQESFAPPAQARNVESAEVQRPERVTSAMDAVAGEPRARQQDAELDDQRRVLRLQVAGDPRRDVVRDHTSNASTLRLERPADGTLQFLPGKLEVVEGRDVGQEIRFVKTAGPEGQTITFGRAEGAQYRHIQLQEHTVSRQHAKMMLDGKTWTLVNMSRTNPVTVNGLPLAAEGAQVGLRDGDRIEMGEVVFRFRAR
jgi:hypothetical protein